MLLCSVVGHALLERSMFRAGALHAIVMMYLEPLWMISGVFSMLASDWSGCQDTRDRCHVVITYGVITLE